MHIRADLPEEARLWAELRAWQEVLPESAAFTGLTALEAFGLWLPPLPPQVPRFVAISTRAGRIRRPQIRASRHPQAPASVEVDGVRLVPVAEALLACARTLGLVDMVVLVDSALHDKHCMVEELRELVASGRPGSRRLRKALDWADARSESAWETLLRVLHRVCGVPVEPQAVLRDATGGFVARADLLIVGTQTLQEYDGARHRTKRRYAGDRRRDSRLSGAGFIRHGYVAEDVLLKPLVILREADLALGRPHDPIRVRAWHALLKESLFTGAGTTQVLRRWGIRIAEEATA